MSKLNKIMEMFWLVMIGVTLFMAIYFINVEGFDSGKWYLLFPLICAFAFTMRRFTRKRLENIMRMEEERKQESKSNSEE